MRAYAAAHDIPRSFGDLDAALAWGEFDAAVNATPDQVHLPTTLQLLAAGKDVFCEKPLAVNHDDALIMTEAARLPANTDQRRAFHRRAANPHQR